jgi:hypothetical protein
MSTTAREVSDVTRSTNYRFDVIIKVEEDDFKRLATMEVYDVEDSDPVRLPISEESVPYYEGMDLGRLAWRTWEMLTIPPAPTPEISDLIRMEDESNA